MGRGPLAGPVVAAAVIIPDDKKLRRALMRDVDDSKVLSAAKRMALDTLIRAHCIVAVAEASVAEIDDLNIYHATLKAMNRALTGLAVPCAALVDGNAPIRGWQGHQQTVVGGDGKELAIACASIVAKVHRDALMARFGEEFPHYGWARNAGYGTALHLEALRLHGACRHHRTSFAPVRAVLEQMEADRGAQAA